MDVNFAVTTPASWASSELNNRSNNLESPSISAWAVQRKPWVRAISSAKVNDSFELRNSYVLFSGKLNTFESSYNPSNFRPRPGITSMEMDFKGTMGSTRSITLNFQCWTKEDLEALEKIYMVPGMSIIVEWGWSVTSDGTDVTPVASFLENPSPNSYYLSDTMKQIIERRQSFTGNYDGFIGVVSNFNYSMNSDLGFDCSIEIIGPGEMFLEESAINNSGKCKDLENLGKSKNNYEYEMNLLYYSGKKPEYIDSINTLRGTICVVKQTWELEAREYDKNARTGITGQLEGALDMINSARESEEVYISWAYFVNRMNALLGKILAEKAKTITAAGESGAKGSNPKLGLDLIPLTVLPKFCSADPRICTFLPINIDAANGQSRQNYVELQAAAPTPPPSEEETGKETSTIDAVVEWAVETGKSIVSTVATVASQAVRTAFTTLDQPEKTLYPTKSLPSLDSISFASEQITKFGDKVDLENLEKNKNVSVSIDNGIGLLNNIFINTAYVRDLLTNEDDLTIEDLLSKVLNDLNDATGGLWSLQYTVTDEDPSRLHIYDANYTSLDSRDPSKIKPFVFSTNKILPLNVSVESKLVDGFKEMVLYDTQTTDNGTTNSSNSGNKLYAGDIQDGFKQPSKSVDDCTPNPEQQKQIQIDVESDLDAAYFLLLEAVEDVSVSGAKTALKQYLKFLEDKKPENAKLLPRNNNILLPFSFNIDIDGFSGLVWGNAISFEYLPKRYDGKVYFQITKIKHSLNPDQWITSYETVMRVVNTDDRKNSDTDASWRSVDVKQLPVQAVKEANEQFAVAESTNTGAQTQVELQMARDFGGKIPKKGTKGIKPGQGATGKTTQQTKNAAAGKDKYKASLADALNDAQNAGRGR